MLGVKEIQADGTATQVMNLPDLPTPLDWADHFVSLQGGKMTRHPEHDSDGWEAYRWEVIGAAPRTFLLGYYLPVSQSQSDFDSINGQLA